MATEIVTQIPAELERAVAETGLAPDGAASLAAGFAPHFIAFRTLAERAETIAPDAPKAARALRLELKAIRVEAEHTRKALKEDSLRRGKAIDGINALLIYSLAPVEERMEEIEKAEERREAARKAALLETRRAELSPLCDVTHYALADMSEEAYQSLLAGQKAAKAAAEEAARKAEADRIAAEAAAAAERARIEAEREAERVRMVAENARLAAEKAEADAREAATREDARKAKAEADRLAAIEAERVRVEGERQRVEAAHVKAAAAAPDKDKLAAFAEKIRGLSVPVLATDAGRALQGEIAEQVEKFARWVDARADKL